MSLLDVFKSLSWEQKLVLLALTSGFYCPSALIAPSLPSEAAKHNVTAGITGVMFSVGSFVPLVAGPFIGPMIGAIGPKISFLTGVTLAAVSRTSLGLLANIQSTEGFVSGVFICLAGSSLGGSVTYISIMTYVAKMFPANMSMIVGMCEAYIATAEIIGLFLGGLLRDAGGFQLPFLVFGSIQLLSVPLNMYLLPKDGRARSSVDPNNTPGEQFTESDEIKNPKGPNNLNNEGIGPGTTKKMKAWEILKVPRALLMALTLLIEISSWSFLMSTLEPHLAPLQLSATQTNSIFTLTSIFYGFSGPFWGWVSDRMPSKWGLMAVGCVLGGLAYPFLGPLPILMFQNSVWHNVITVSVIALLSAAVEVPVCNTCLSYTLEAGFEDNVATYAIVSGTTSTFTSAGSVIGTFIGGFLIESVGYPLAAASYGAVCIGWGTFVTLFFLLAPAPKKGQGKIIGEDLPGDSVQMSSLAGVGPKLDKEGEGAEQFVCNAAFN